MIGGFQRGAFQTDFQQETATPVPFVQRVELSGGGGQGSYIRFSELKKKLSLQDDAEIAEIIPVIISLLTRK